jgi:hypothetical protein
MARLSNHAKIIDLNSEYYGQVFEVDNIHVPLEEVDLVRISKNRIVKNIIGNFTFDQIQFCVTKDNEPVKIGGEYLCLQDKFSDCQIYDFVEVNNDVVVWYHNTILAKHKDWCILLSTISYEHQPLHSTNKIKITAGGKEYWISREQFKNITNTTN